MIVKFILLLLCLCFTGCVETQPYIIERPYSTSHVYYYREYPYYPPSHMVYIERYHRPNLNREPSFHNGSNNDNRRNDNHGRKP